AATVAAAEVPFFGPYDTEREFLASAPAAQAVTPHTVAARPLPPLGPLAPPAPSVQRVAPAPQDFVAFSPFTTPAPASSQRPASAPGGAAGRAGAAGAAAPGAEPPAAPAPAAPPAAGPEAAISPSGHSEKDLDELARKLHDRISLHLRRDLLIQRERAGMV